ncbi:NADP-dependent oxidoreductase [Ohtaekwangia kribbensis]|uniref:NADP-dependent oxidoreductase n=1 Tax=Ohtaekwangia kribbensis TaxID=688913 RepID=A0ABW3K8M3_9BACT
MKAFTINRYSKKEKLQLSEVTIPAIKENDVLVQVDAAGVNLLDSLIKNGDFKLFLPYKFPLTLGHDVAGIVTKVGSHVRKFKVGDAVYARPSDYSIGSFAEFISFNENDAALKPKKITMEEAASLPLVGLTAWQSLIEIAKLKSGQKVFIQAGSGGVGTFAIQLAKHVGAFVATTTSDANTALVQSLGADLVIDYKKEDFSTKLKDYDVVLHSNRDPKVLDQSLRILKPGGHLISLVGPPTPEFAKELDLPWYLKFITKVLSSGVKKKAKKLGVNYSFLFMKADGHQLNEIRSLVEAGKIRPVVDKIFAFKKTNDAMTYIESGRAKGKVVIKISER